MTEGASDRFCINCRIIRETEKAWLIDPDGHSKVWMPKSQGEVYKREDGTHDLFAEEWILKTKGLI